MSEIRFDDVIDTAPERVQRALWWLDNWWQDIDYKTKRGSENKLNLWFNAKALIEHDHILITGYSSRRV